MRTILIIDDEAGYRDWLRFELEGPEFSVLTAAGGREGLAVLERETVDAVVTDMKMPGMNGLEIVAAIKKSRPKLPIILITGYSHTLGDWVDRALAMKARTCLSKPFPADALRAELRAAGST